MNTHVDVALAERSYRIEIGPAASQSLAALIQELEAKGRRLAVIADAGLLSAQPDLLSRHGVSDDSVITVPQGEPSKSIAQFSRLLSELAQRALGRDSVVLALGGGVCGDLAGYVAASYLRGVDFYQIPTTLLAMVDSSVGGKTGINLPEGKNLVGAFWQPKGVFILPALLSTLPAREFSAGVAEVIKYGMLCDIQLFEKLEQLPSLAAEDLRWSEIIARCCALKATIVGADERETAGSGGRALLNLGHTFAHAIEQVSGYGAYLHGEAVAIGLSLATRMAIVNDNLDPAIQLRVDTLLERYNLPIRLRAPLDTEALLKAMRKDKKNRAGKLYLISMHNLGQAYVTDQIAESLIRSLWQDAGAA
jgi:3-dehydroquinate synthase